MNVQSCFILFWGLGLRDNPLGNKATTSLTIAIDAISRRNPGPERCHGHSGSTSQLWQMIRLQITGGIPEKHHRTSPWMTWTEPNKQSSHVWDMPWAYLYNSKMTTCYVDHRRSSSCCILIHLTRSLHHCKSSALSCSVVFCDRMMFMGVSRKQLRKWFIRILGSHGYGEFITLPGSKRFWR